ncbi:hypothetical protein [Coraliomargarita akajimensis]|uniref:F5/8 type C domain-containing protein n=1 Tax=Coraliomargarita akajimensis (strain DSM 45221 / IAM 15411 / JCM 23193 / KCTC 12865 / 04OKA010-24) TaxID=583355 RepID=D5ENT7_CORAD|nr:hypothetical protein [Coraliomargarita akajimensis]ADE53596.1 hypothetical protein Caka_0571 [Coraliomargarita akajimensis DSM 45221]
MKVSLRKLTILLLFAAQAASILHANVELWSITLPPASYGDEGHYLVRVGQDGSVIVVDGYMNATSAKWYNRSGDLIKEFDIEPFYGYGVTYVSQHEVVLSGRSLTTANNITDLYQLNAGNQLINTRKLISIATSHSSHVKFHYPYFVEWIELEGGGYKLTLMDLTLPEVFSVIGDAVIGVHGSNLKVRWKTVANTKYKVQSSTDLETWSDYTEIIDGNGSTMIVNIPLDESVDSKYARVIKL